MSGIRFIIALLFLIAGVETELRADVSHCHPADSHNPLQSNLTNKTSLEKPTQVAAGMDLWILPARVILRDIRYKHSLILPKRFELPHKQQTDHSDCFSGCSPPSSSLS